MEFQAVYVQMKKKSECNNLQILFDLYSNEYSMKTGYLMFELINSLFIWWQKHTKWTTQDISTFLKGCACQSERSKFIVAEIWAAENKSELDAQTEWMIASAVRQRFLFCLLPLVLSSLLSVQEEVDRRSFLLPVRSGHSGKHYVWHECPTEEPW